MCVSLKAGHCPRCVRHPQLEAAAKSLATTRTDLEAADKALREQTDSWHGELLEVIAQEQAAGVAQQAALKEEIKVGVWLIVSLRL